MKRFSALLCALILLLGLTACGGSASGDALPGISLEETEIVQTVDTYSAETGKGIRFQVYSFPGGAPALEGEKAWSPLPMDGTLISSLYGGPIQTSGGILCAAPLFTDEDGVPLAPVFEHGYALFRDRHPNAASDDPTVLFDRDKLHFDLNVYDSDSGLLYCMSIDT